MAGDNHVTQQQEKMNIVPGSFAVDRIGFDNEFVQRPRIVANVFHQPGRVGEMFVENADRRHFLRDKSGARFEHLWTNTLLAKLPQQRH
ncbi:hypothetical protein GA0061070_103843 [Kosakonia oryziphila]|uniref:Uncharacterized protein n=1 Tax=Kosakonia oryziphila TaxID=1005667 RepID=A0A1C4FL92_9ENTR|nr:hypothetical protein GA0061070_103843 [Kosakonia oryziphila]